MNPLEDNKGNKQEVFGSSDPTFWDYVRVKDFIKKTGIEEKDCHAFCLKELIDNACDIVEKWQLPRQHNASITIDIRNDPDETNTMTISVSNPNPDNRPVFTNLEETFNYKRSFSSKSNQYKITRGAQGDALKELGTIPYMLTNNTENSSSDKQWGYPLTFMHNKRIERVYIKVNRKDRMIQNRIEREDDDRISTDTNVIITLPALSSNAHLALLEYCQTYTFFNTHLSFQIFCPPYVPTSMPVLLPMSEHYNNPNSIYCYSQQEFQDFLTDLYDKEMSVYDALIKSDFREINQTGRFEDLKDITIGQLTVKNIREIYNRLKKSMLAMSELSTPYQAHKGKRKEALIKRYAERTQLDLDYDKAIYEKTRPQDTIYNDETIRFPFTFEVLAIPIKNQAQQQEESIVVSGVNYSTSINNKSYFTSDRYVYSWNNERGTHLQAFNIEEIIRVSSAGANIDFDDNIAPRKQRKPCIIMVHLVSPRPEYKHGYGKSTLKLEPYSVQIAQLIERVVKRIPLRNRTAPSKEYEGPTGNLDLLLAKRWAEVRANLGILDPYSPDYDPWTQSTVWYHLREEYLLPTERNYGVTLIKSGTRTSITARISERCEMLEGSPKREQLGIFASPRATMYVNGQWYRIDIDSIPEVAGKGTDVIFIEKQGIVEIIKHLADTYGFAFVNTQGHFAEYPRNLVPEITEQGGNVVILTDFDCAGIHIAERIIADDISYNYVDKRGNTSLEEKKGYRKRQYIGERVKHLGIDTETLEYIISKVNEEGGQTITVEVRQEDGSLAKEAITTLDQLIEHVQESYPKAEKPEDKQQPGVNVVTSLIRYAKKYCLTKGHSSSLMNMKYKRYKYIFDSFEYLTGLNVNDTLRQMNLDNHEDELESYEKDILNDLLEDREPTAAKRIELDSVLKVVKAKMFEEFIVHKLLEFFPERKYIDRAITIPTEYFGEKFNILPEKTRKLLQRVTEMADKAAKSTEEAIRGELENWSPSEEQLQQDIPTLLVIPTERMVNERLITEAVADDPDIQAFEEEAERMLDELPVPAADEEEDDEERKGEGEDQQQQP